MKIKIALISIFLISAGSIYGMSMTPSEKLFEGAKHGKMELIEEALKEGADVNSQYRINNKNFHITALMMAASWGYNKIVEKLIKAGADVNLQDINGNTALMKAVINGRNEIVKQLLKTANLSIKNNKGQTAIDIAEERNYSEILKILEDEQQKPIRQYLSKEEEVEEIYEV